MAKSMVKISLIETVVAVIVVSVGARPNDKRRGRYLTMEEALRE